MHFLLISVIQSMPLCSVLMFLKEGNHSFKIIAHLRGCGFAKHLFSVIQKWLEPQQVNFMEERKVSMIFVFSNYFLIIFDGK